MFVNYKSIEYILYINVILLIYALHTRNSLVSFGSWMLYIKVFILKNA